MIKKLKLTSRQCSGERFADKYYITFTKINNVAFTKINHGSNYAERFIMESSAYFASSELQNRDNTNTEIIDRITAMGIISSFNDETCTVSIITDDETKECGNLATKEIEELFNDLVVS